MDRRNFTKRIIAGAALGGIPSSVFGLSTTKSMKRKKLKPKRLRAGQSIGLIAPGSSIDEQRLEKAITNIESFGLRPVYTKNILAKHGYLAGKDESRLSDIHQMFSDSKIDGIWCVRGGYGCTRLLQDIDYKLIKKNPKPIIGYSDITALLQAIYKKTGLIGFHGPVAVSDPTNYTMSNFKKVLMNPSKSLVIQNAVENQESASKNFQTKVITSGKAQGKLIGGNLSLISALAGTKYQICVKDRILFLEDIGEKPYRIDRMLTQLMQSCNLSKASAIVLGIFDGCEGGNDSLTLMDTLQDRLGSLGIPVIYGMSFGHIDHQMTLPIGIKAEIDTKDQTITLLERAVQ